MTAAEQADRDNPLRVLFFALGDLNCDIARLFREYDRMRKTLKPLRRFRVRRRR